MSVSFHTEGRTFVLRIDMDAHPFIAHALKARLICIGNGWVKMTATANAVLARAIARILTDAAPYPKPDPMPEFPEFPDASHPIH